MGEGLDPSHGSPQGLPYVADAVPQAGHYEKIVNSPDPVPGPQRGFDGLPGASTPVLLDRDAESLDIDVQVESMKRDGARWGGGEAVGGRKDGSAADADVKTEVVVVQPESV